MRGSLNHGINLAIYNTTEHTYSIKITKNRKTNKISTRLTFLICPICLRGKRGCQTLADKTPARRACRDKSTLDCFSGIVISEKDFMNILNSFSVRMLFISTRDDSVLHKKAGGATINTGVAIH